MFSLEATVAEPVRVLYHTDFDRSRPGAEQRRAAWREFYRLHGCLPPFQITSSYHLIDGNHRIDVLREFGSNNWAIEVEHNGREWIPTGRLRRVC